MKVVIFAGGLGTRLSELTDKTPKPMIEIGGKPILWHIMKIYEHYGFTDFIILAGYKQEIIKNYFQHHCLDWNVTVVDTGLQTATGGRLRRVRELLGKEPFLLTYGDSLADIDIAAVISAHRNNQGLITMTTVNPPSRFGIIKFDHNGRVTSFAEKPKLDDQWINMGFFVCEPAILDYINGDTTIFEEEPLKNLARDGKLYAYKHFGFFKPMDTLRDKNELEELWEKGAAQWKIWR